MSTCNCEKILDLFIVSQSMTAFCKLHGAFPIWKQLYCWWRVASWLPIFCVCPCRCSRSRGTSRARRSAAPPRCCSSAWTESGSMWPPASSAPGTSSSTRRCASKSSLSCLRRCFMIIVFREGTRVLVLSTDYFPTVKSYDPPPCSDATNIN